MAALPALMLILMAALPRIDPKHQNYEKFKGVWNASLTALTIFMSAMSWFSELSVFGLIPEGSSLVGILVCGGCGVLFIFWATICRASSRTICSAAKLPGR